jgi:hypothetical protein
MRYEIKQISDRDGIREFAVGNPDQPEYERRVWVSGDGVPRCVNCPGLLTAMKASRRHAMAVRRFLAPYRDALMPDWLTYVPPPKRPSRIRRWVRRLLGWIAG